MLGLLQLFLCRLISHHCWFFFIQILITQSPSILLLQVHLYFCFTVPNGNASLFWSICWCVACHCPFVPHPPPPLRRWWRNREIYSSVRVWSRSFSLPWEYSQLNSPLGVLCKQPLGYTYFLQMSMYHRTRKWKS